MRQIFTEEERKAHKEVLFWAKRLSYASADKHPEWRTRYEEAKLQLAAIKAGGKDMRVYKYVLRIESIYRKGPFLDTIYAENDAQAHRFICQRWGGVYDFQILSMTPKEVAA